MLTWIGFAINVVATFMNIAVNPWGFMVWTLGNILFIYNAVKKKEWSTVAMFGFYIIMNFYGFFSWVTK